MTKPYAMYKDIVMQMFIIEFYLKEILNYIWRLRM